MTLTQTYRSSITPYWRPSDELQKTLRILYEEDYAQFPVPIAHAYYIHYLQNG